MDKEKIDRINTLARKQKTVGLTAAEVQEQAALRQEYLQEWRRGVQAMLENVVIQRPDGTRETLKKKHLN